MPYPPPPPPSAQTSLFGVSLDPIMRTRYHAARIAAVRASMFDVRLWRYLCAANVVAAVWYAAQGVWDRAFDVALIAVLTAHIAHLTNRHRALAELLAVQPRHADRLPLSVRYRRWQQRRREARTLEDSDEVTP